MSGEQDPAKSIEPKPSTEVAPPKDPLVAILAALPEVGERMTRPLAQADVAKAQEETRRVQIAEDAETKRIEIAAITQRKNTNAVTIVAGMVIALAVAGLFFNQPELAEKIVIALLSAAGGYGLGTSRKSKK